MMRGGAYCIPIMTRGGGPIVASYDEGGLLYACYMFDEGRGLLYASYGEGRGLL